MDDIRKTQESFARKAQTQPAHRFGDLYHLICREDWLRKALEKVLSNPGSRTAGVDQISRKHLKEDGQKTVFIQALQAELKGGTYRPQPVKRHWIPKANGKQRPLGIPTLKDRVVQMTLKMLLEPIWESDFLDCSNGFRPGRRTMDCIQVCRSRITTQNKYLWIVEGDIKGYYARKHPHPYLIETEPNNFPDAVFPLYWEGKTTPEKAAWTEVRLAVLQRDGYRCVECSGPNHLHVHHIRSRRNGGTAQMDNLQTLCKDCHAKTPSWGRPKGISGSTQSWRAG